MDSASASASASASPSPSPSLFRPDIPLSPSSSPTKSDPSDLLTHQPPHHHSSPASFPDQIKTLQETTQEVELPTNLPGGVLMDQLYSVPPADLNALIFSPDSKFPAALSDFQGKTELHFGPWQFENDILQRQVTYLTPPSKLTKPVKAFENQTYKLATEDSFAVLVSVSTPDVMYGSTFRVEMLYCITPGPELPSGEQSSRLLASWGMNFVQSTMMKGMIENGARPAVKESFVQFSSVLSEHVKPVDPKDTGSQKDQVLASLQAEPVSDWKLAVQYFANFTVVSTFFIGIYVFIHICLTAPSTIQGLEFVGLDLPDSIGEVIVCSVLVLQAKRVFELVARFMQARLQKGNADELVFFVVFYFIFT